MMAGNEHRVRPQNFLINLLVQTREHQPSYTLFLGAGASIKSGVKSATTLVAEWRERYASIYGENDPKLLRMKEESGEYSFLFEELFDQPSPRRQFIETCISGAEPSWGYIYLVNLIHARVFNTVFTTNFDDLLNEACFAYSSSVRPVVCAHDSSIDNVRIFSARPKIIKLHGDFLFDSIKNTTVETAKLEKNMREKFEQYATEFGMIVMGYSGNDRSIMAPIEEILESGKGFPGGIYWCIRAGAVIPRQLDRLLRYDKFRLIEIEGFDEFCADLHNALGLTMQPELADPYGALTNKINGLMRQMGLPETGESHPVIERDVARLAEQLAGLAVSERLHGELLPITKADSAPFPVSVGRMPVPFVFLANFFLRRGEVVRAQICAAEALREQPSQNAFEVAFRSLRICWDEKFSTYLISLLEKSLDLFREPAFETNQYALEVLNAGKFDDAEKLFALSNRVLRTKDQESLAIADLNSAQLFIHRGLPLPTKLAVAAQQMLNDENMTPACRMGAAIILGEWPKAEEYLNLVIKTDPMQGSQIPTWPIYSILEPHLTENEMSKALKEIRQSYLSGKIDFRSSDAVHRILRLTVIQ